ncbi:hypothetical protein PI124_g9888 [Phytophthora idaei]|nr:hypothetical protein PI125_g12306 [Phytophthora idaei]KAG3159952.1 hypothetical protein PI126_g7120 [Phytophthora idaei]KAG3245352.1 hypothetical protein PI124_g9888 [Phytophthora idaei]
MQLRVDWVESPQALHNRVVSLERQVAQLPQASPDWVADLERQVTQLHGQLDLLLRLQPYAPRPVAPPLAVVQPPAAQLPAPAPPRSPEQGPGMA